MFFRRGIGDRSDRWLHAKLWIFTAGALLALVGMGLENEWLIGAAGLVLAIGLVLRFLPRRAGSRDGRPDDAASGASHRPPPASD